MRLSDDELRDVLTRAEEIQRATLQMHDMKAELEAVVGAAEEMGLPRAAVELALRERLELTAPPEVGKLTFAKSTDGKLYAAEVRAIREDGVTVRFLRGGEHVVLPTDLMPCRFLPGDRVIVDWPWWGEWTCSVLSYDSNLQMVRLSDGWGDTHTCHAGDVWVEGPEREKKSKGLLSRTLFTLAGGAGVGAVIGSLLTAFFLR